MKEYRLHGPPGCGKSHALATVWIPKAVDRFGAGNVVICSLTKTAAAELTSRDLPIPRDNVGTLHALAYRALGRPDIAESRISDWNHQHPIYRMTGAKASTEDLDLVTVERGTIADSLMAQAQVYRHSQTPISLWRDDVRAFHIKWTQWMQAEDLTDFTGLIEQALEGVDCAPNNPAVFAVDEAQDCSALELALVRKWAESAEYVVLAGDGDQAIYGWRGASAKAFLSDGIPKDHNYHLTQSYRVPRAVHAVASNWIDQASFRYAVEYKPRDEQGAVSMSKGSSRNTQPIIESLSRDLAEDRSVMVLASCGFMLKGLLTALRKDGIPFHNTYRPTNGAWNPLGSRSKRLLEFFRPDPRSYGEYARTWTWGEAAAWVDLISARNVLAPGGKTMIQQQAKDQKLSGTIIEPGDGRACFGPAWDELHKAFESGTSLQWLHDHLLPSKAKAMQYPIKLIRKNGVRAIQEDPKVTVGTIHSVKGGQADSVYLFPDLSRSAARMWVSGPTQSESRDSIVRTFYVGMTRARQKLQMCRRWSAASLDFNLPQRASV